MGPAARATSGAPQGAAYLGERGVGFASSHSWRALGSDRCEQVGEPAQLERGVGYH